MIAVNAHVLYEKANGRIPFLDFKRTIARTYLTTPSFRILRGLADQAFVSLAVYVRHKISETDAMVTSLKEQNEANIKCAVCKKNARKQCQKCNVGINVNCMQKWHK